MDKKFLFLTLIFFLSFTLFTSMIILNKPLSKLTRAKEDLIPSPEKSIIFGWPLSAPADGITKVEINIFVRNLKNLPLSNKKVNVLSNLGEIKEIQPITDKNGKASFIITSSTPGLAEIKAKVDNQIELSQKLTVKFE